MTVATDPRPDPMSEEPDHELQTTDEHPAKPEPAEPEPQTETEAEAGTVDGPVERWSTTTVRSVLANGALPTWQRVVAAINDDPYGRTAGQVAEVIGGELHDGVHDGVAAALSEVLSRTRAELEADERAEVARHMRVLLRRSGLDRAEFGSRIGASPEQLAAYLDADASPPATLMIRMRRLCDRAAAAATEGDAGRSGGDAGSGETG